ncbi:TPA: hypothetical protein ACP32N_005100 [Pseudomonas aeruginosa]
MVMPASWQREALVIRRLAVKATLIAAAALTAACSSVQKQDNSLANAKPGSLSTSQARTLAFDDCNYIIDHLKATPKAGSKARAMSYCLGVDVAKYGMN